MFYDLLEPGLALSGYPSDASVVNEAGFTAVVNCCDGGQKYETGLAPQVKLSQHPLEDCKPNPEPRLALGALQLASLRGEQRFTLVHCAAGLSRSPTVVALYWMGRDSISWQEAVERIQSRRPSVEPNPYLVTEQSTRAVAEKVRALLDGDQEILELTLRRKLRYESELRGFASWVDSRNSYRICDKLGVIGRNVSGRLSRVGPMSHLVVLDVHVPNAIDQSGFRDVSCEPVVAEAQSIRRVVERLLSLRRSSREVWLVPGQDSFAACLVLMLLVMAERDWDMGSAYTWLRSRYQVVEGYMPRLFHWADKGLSNRV